MTSPTDAVLPHPERPTRNTSLLLVGLAVLALGVLLGVLWWVAAPLARADVAGGQVLLAGHQELRAAQDGWFAAVTGLAGVLFATVMALLPGRHEAVSAALAPVLGVLVAVIAWRTGVLLGPSSLVDQVREGATAPLTPLQLHAYGVLLVGPFLFALTRFFASLFSAQRLPADVG